MLIAFTFSTLNAHPLYVQDFCQSPRKATPDISTRKKVAPGCAPVPDREQDRGRDDMRCEPSLCSFSTQQLFCFPPCSCVIGASRIMNETPPSVLPPPKLSQRDPHARTLVWVCACVCARRARLFFSGVWPYGGFAALVAVPRRARTRASACVCGRQYSGPAGS